MQTSTNATNILFRCMTDLHCTNESCFDFLTWEWELQLWRNVTKKNKQTNKQTNNKKHFNAFYEPNIWFSFFQASILVKIPTFLHKIMFNEVCIYSTPMPQAGCDIKSIFKRSIEDLTSEFTRTHCLTKAKELSLPYYFTHSQGRGIHAFSEKWNSFLSRIWDWVTDTISYNDSHNDERHFYTQPLHR